MPPVIGWRSESICRFAEPYVSFPEIDHGKSRPGARHRSGRAGSPNPSRDRQGALSRFLRLEHAHGITLLGEDVLDGRRDVLWFPQPSCAAYPSEEPHLDSGALL